MNGSGQIIAEIAAGLGGVFLAITQVIQIVNQAEMTRLANRSNRKFDEALDAISNQILSLKSDKRQNDRKKDRPYF